MTVLHFAIQWGPWSIRMASAGFIAFGRKRPAQKNRHDPLSSAWTRKAKPVSVRAAELRRISVSDYVQTGHCSLRRGAKILAARRRTIITLTRERQLEFWKALNETPGFRGRRAPCRIAHARASRFGVHFPAGHHLLNLEASHPRRTFHSGEARVDDWLATKALQHQQKHLSVTKVVVDEAELIAGYYTLATGQSGLQ